MKTLALFASLLMVALTGKGGVRVFVSETNGLAAIRYECTAGEVIRAFALNVTVDRGQILAVTNYLRGPSSAATPGYGIFPASFRDHVTVTSGSNANWAVSGYSPAAVVGDNPGDTLPGLGSSGVTLEFAAIWDSGVLATIPPAAGLLCSLQLSQTANVSVAPNTSRGGIIPSPPDLPITVQYAGALVGPAITDVALAGGTLTVRFQDGELESAPAVTGPWTGTGNTSGFYTQSVSGAPKAFFRVRKN